MFSCCLLILECPLLKNGVIVCNNDTDKRSTGVVGDNCTFSCHNGFELQGSFAKKCLPTGNWEGGNPMCVAGKLVVTWS